MYSMNKHLTLQRRDNASHAEREYSISIGVSFDVPKRYYNSCGDCL